MRTYTTLDRAEVDSERNLLLLSSSDSASWPASVAMRREGEYLAMSYFLGPAEIALRLKLADVTRALSHLQPADGQQTPRQVGGGQASLQVIGQGDISFLVKGRARLLKPQLDGAAPYVIQLWEMEVVGAKDQSWPGVSTSALAYEWPAAQREAMLRMEQAVYQEMRDAK